jgi:hypothetical protein
VDYGIVNTSVSDKHSTAVFRIEICRLRNGIGYLDGRIQVTTDDQSANSFWCPAAFGACSQIIFCVKTVTIMSILGALSDERASVICLHSERRKNRAPRKQTGTGTSSKLTNVLVGTEPF